MKRNYALKASAVGNRSRIHNMLPPRLSAWKTKGAKKGSDPLSITPAGRVQSE